MCTAVPFHPLRHLARYGAPTSVHLPEYGLPHKINSDEYYAAPNPAVEGDYTTLPDAVVLNVPGDHPSATSAANSKTDARPAKKQGYLDAPTANTNGTTTTTTSGGSGGPISCSYVSANRKCHTVVTGGTEYCAKHSCPSCTASKSSKSATCQSCATRTTQFAGHSKGSSSAGYGGDYDEPPPMGQGEDLFRVQAVPVDEDADKNGTARRKGKKAKRKRHSKHAISLRPADTGGMMLNPLAARISTETTM